QLPGGAGVPGLLRRLGLLDELVGERRPGAQELRRPGVLTGVGGVLDRAARAVDLVDQPAGVQRRDDAEVPGVGAGGEVLEHCGSFQEAARTASLIDLTPPWAVIPPSTGISAPVM